jgi:Tfp pilus assembly protein PilO
MLAGRCEVEYGIGTNRRNEQRSTMKQIVNCLLIAIACLLAGCSHTQESETTELRRAMKQQMTALRAQLKASGATVAQLREFDRAIAALDQPMRQLERQMQAMETVEKRGE